MWVVGWKRLGAVVGGVVESRVATSCVVGRWAFLLVLKSRLGARCSCGCPPCSPRSRRTCCSPSAAGARDPERRASRDPVPGGRMRAVRRWRRRAIALSLSVSDWIGLQDREVCHKVCQKACRVPLSQRSSERHGVATPRQDCVGVAVVHRLVAVLAAHCRRVVWSTGHMVALAMPAGKLC